MRTARSVWVALMSTENLISEVVIARMLIFCSERALECLCRDAGVAAHADPDNGHLGNVGRAIEPFKADRAPCLVEA